MNDLRPVASATVARAAILALPVLATLVLATGLKIARYAQGDQPPPIPAAERITRHLSGFGWSVATPLSKRAGDLYDWMAFAHPACPRPLTIGFLGANVESAELFARDQGGEAVFLQDGAVLARPSGYRRQVATLAEAMQWLAGRQLPPRLPLPNALALFRPVLFGSRTSEREAHCIEYRV